jgi:hypothetical protein
MYQTVRSRNQDNRSLALDLLQLLHLVIRVAY